MLRETVTYKQDGIVHNTADRPQGKNYYQSEAEQRYYAAFVVVLGISEDVEQGKRHYRNRQGQLLTTMDQVVNAILAGELAG